MKTLERSALVPFSAQQMYDLVNNVEAYPEFVRGCRRSTILKETDKGSVVKLDLESKGIKQSFTTRNTLTPPHSIHMQLVDGPFKTLDGMWTFEPIDDTSCTVRFKLSFAFSNFLLAMAAGKMMDTMANDQVEAMVARAHTLYDNN